MKVDHLILGAFLSSVSALPGVCATLTVQTSATFDSGVYDYSYQLSVTRAGPTIDNIYLGSADLPPLNVTLAVDGVPADLVAAHQRQAPNYLQFFEIGGTALGNGDTLTVTFSTSLAPVSAGLALGLDSAILNTTNTVIGVVSPSTVPESSSLALVLAIAVILVIGAVVRRPASLFERRRRG